MNSTGSILDSRSRMTYAVHMARTYRRDPNTHGTTRKWERTVCRGRDCICKSCTPKRGNSQRLNIRDLRRLDVDLLAEVG